MSYDAYSHTSPSRRLAQGSPAPSLSNASAKGKTELLQMAVSESRGEIQSLRSNVGTLQDTISGHARVLQQYKTQLRDREDENRQLVAANATLKRELADLRRDKDDADRSQNKYTSLTSKLQQELDEVRARADRYRADLELSIQRSDAAEHALDELRRAHAQVSDSLAVTQDTTRRALDDGAAREAGLQVATTTAAAALEEVGAELREAKARAAGCQTALQERERELQALQEHSRQQTAEALGAQEELARLRRQASEAALQGQTLAERLAAQEAARRQLEGEADSWCTRHDDAQRSAEDLRRQLEDRVGELERLQRAAHGKDDEIEELRERGRFQAAQIGEHEAGIRSLEKQLQERVEHISYLEAKLQAQERDAFERSAKVEDLTRERAALLAQVETLNASLDESHAEVLRARDEGAQAREHARADVEEARRQLSQVKADLSNARARIAQLEGKLATVDDFRADLQSQLRDAEAQNQQFQTRIADQRRELSEWGAVIVKLQGEKEEAQSAADLLTQDKLSLQAQLQRLQQKHDDARAEARALRDELTLLQEQAARREQDAEVLARTLEDRTLHIAALEEKCEKGAQALSEKVREIRALQQQVDDERNQVSAASIEISRLEGRVHAKEDECEGLRDKTVHLRDNLQRLEAQLRRLENLPSVVETQEAEIDRMRHQLSRLEDENQTAARNSHSLQQRLSEKEAAHQTAQMRISDLTLEAQHMTKLRDELQAQLADKAQDIIRLKGAIARLEGKVDAMDEAHRQYEAKCIQLETDKEGLRATLDATADERAAALRELNQVRDRTEALEATRDAAERQANDVSLQLLRAREETEDQRAAGAQMSAELQRLRQLQHLPGVLQGKEEELARLQEALQRLEGQATSTADVVRDATMRSTGFEAALADRERENGDLKRDLARKTADAEQAMSEVLAKTNEVSRLKSSLARLEGRFQVMAEASEDRKAHTAVLEDEVRHARHAADMSAAAVSAVVTAATASSGAAVAGAGAAAAATPVTPRMYGSTASYLPSAAAAGGGSVRRVSPRRDRSISPAKATDTRRASGISISGGNIVSTGTRHYSPLKRAGAADDAYGGSVSRSVPTSPAAGYPASRTLPYSSSRLTALTSATTSSVRGSPMARDGRYTPRTYQ